MQIVCKRIVCLLFSFIRQIDTNKIRIQSFRFVCLFRRRQQQKQRSETMNSNWPKEELASEMLLKRTLSCLKLRAPEIIRPENAPRRDSVC